MSVNPPAAPVRPVANDEFSVATGNWLLPQINYGLAFRDYGYSGLRQYSGFVREEFLPQLRGQQSTRVYREMFENSPTVGAMLFAVMQAMRKVRWCVEPPVLPNGDDGPDTEVAFVESLLHDMSHTWDDFIQECLTMLVYGFSLHEIVYKRRNGRVDGWKNSPGLIDKPAGSKFDDGRIGWRRLPIRSQDTILKWFFNDNGQIKGATQQPFIGYLTDIPIEKLLLFRPSAHKNNPEGRSVLRNSYLPYWFIKRLQEQEAITFERLNGLPVMSVPSTLLEAANSGTNPAAKAQLLAYQSIARNVRIDEQMGIVIPSDTYKDLEGKPSNARMYHFELLTPQHGRATVNAHETIERYKVDILMTLLADFIHMGHEVRGTNNLAVTKVDMFYQAIGSWLGGIADVINRYALPRLWDFNGLNPDLMPRLCPDMASRLDLDSLGTYIANIAAAGMPLFPDEELQEFVREAAGMPEITSPEAEQMMQETHDAAIAPKETIKRMVMAAVAKQILAKRAAK